MTELHEQLAAEIEAAVRAVDGVTTVFRAGSTAAKVIGAGSQRVGIRNEAAALVRLDLSEERPSAELAIGVCVGANGVDTLRRVHEVVAETLAARQIVNPAIKVTVMHVNGAR